MASDPSPSPHRTTPLRHALTMTKVGVIGFGGGSALIPVMEKELVKPGGLRDDEFVQDTVIANITPGALPVKLAALAGARLSGTIAAALGALAVTLPGAAATVALLALFSALGETAIRWVEFASLGVSAFILYLLAHYVGKVLAPGGRVRMLPVAIAIAAFLATGAAKTVVLVGELLGVEPGWLPPELTALGLILVSLGLIGLVTIVQLVRRRIRGIPHAPHAAAPSTLRMRRVLRAAGVAFAISVVAFFAALLALPEQTTASFLGLIAMSTVSSFGGGEAYVGVADGFFVASGLVDATTFYGQIVPVANALPGPILVKIAAGIGYVVGAEQAGLLIGVLVAAAIVVLTALLCAGVALALLAGYATAGNSLLVRNISAYILPVICGLLAATAVSLLHASVGIGDGAGAPGVWIVVGSVALAVVAPLLKHRMRLPDIALIGLYAALSLGVLLSLAASAA